MTALVLAEPEATMRGFLEAQLRSDGFDVGQGSIQIFGAERVQIADSPVSSTTGGAISISSGGEVRLERSILSSGAGALALSNANAGDIFIQAPSIQIEATDIIASVLSAGLVEGDLSAGRIDLSGARLSISGGSRLLTDNRIRGTSGHPQNRLASLSHNTVLTSLPRPQTVAATAPPMPAAIRPYSIAVAPLTSVR